MYEVRVPKLTETPSDIQLIEWVAKEGEQIKARQVLAILETEKSSYELESQHPGILHIVTPADVTVPVKHVIGLLAETQEEYEKIKSS